MSKTKKNGRTCYEREVLKTKLMSKPQSKSGRIVFRMTFPRSELKLTKTPFGMSVTLKECVQGSEIGGPGLPTRMVRVALPPFTRATTIQVRPRRLIRLTRKPLLLTPMQPLRPGMPKATQLDSQRLQMAERLGVKPSALRPPEKAMLKSTPAARFVQHDKHLYRQAMKKPRPVARLIRTEQFGLTPVATIELNPVRYNRSALLEFYPDIEIVVSYEPAGSAQLPVEGRPTAEWVKPIRSQNEARRWVDAARLAVINPTDVVDLSNSFPRQYFPVDYLIITDNKQWDAANITPGQPVGDLVTVFERLASWKSQRGLATRVVTVTDIVNGTYGDFRTNARDLQEVIRNFLKWAYNYWGISWLLLGGDVQIIPVRQVAGDLCAGIKLQDTDPPPDDKSCWASSFLKIKVVNPEWGWPSGSQGLCWVTPWLWRRG